MYMLTYFMLCAVSSSTYNICTKLSCWPDYLKIAGATPEYLWQKLVEYSVNTRTCTFTPNHCTLRTLYMCIVVLCSIAIQYMLHVHAKYVMLASWQSNNVYPYFSMPNSYRVKL